MNQLVEIQSEKSFQDHIPKVPFKYQMRQQFTKKIINKYLADITNFQM
jgi:hypothetical protein